MQDNKNICKNCHAEFEGNYCNQCGQKSSVKRFTVKGLLHDLPHTIFHVDKGIFKNLQGLQAPQKTVQEYISGKRVVYFNPLLFFLISTGLVLYVEHASHFEAHFGFVLTWHGKYYDVGSVVLKFLKYIYLCSAFLMAIPSRFIFKKDTGYNYAEHVIANIFILGYVNVVYLFLTVIPFYEFFVSHWFVNTFPMNLSVMILFYIFTGLVYYNKNRPVWGWVKSAFALVLQVFIFHLFLGIIGLLTILQG
jgi:hypothetical protein